MNTGRKTINVTLPKMGTKRGFRERGFWAEGSCSLWDKRNTFWRIKDEKQFWGPKKKTEGGTVSEIHERANFVCGGKKNSPKNSSKKNPHIKY